MNQIPFKIGYCLGCGAQTQVRDVSGRPVCGLPGTKLCWLCLCDEKGQVKTRVGTITFCKSCDPLKANLDHVKNNLTSSRYSGVSSTEPEWDLWPIKKIEVVKVYEEEELVNA